MLAAVTGAATATPITAREIPASTDASKELAKPDWKPQFLDEHQNETLIVFSELVLPGSRDALVNRFLDLLMTVEKPETQFEFITSLGYIDGLSMERCRCPFTRASDHQQIEILDSIASGSGAGPEHFSRLKTWIVGAYYSSPAGLKDIGWDGSFPHGDLAGCTR
jgi:hypothetical protein